VEGGSFGLLKIHSRTTGRRGAASGVLSVSRTQVDGFRQQSETEFTQVSLGGDYLAGSRTAIGVRFGYTDAPKAENPGALTATEVGANPDSAAGNNILRKADKAVSQGQLAVTVRRHNDRGEFAVSAFGLRRDLENPLATPPPQGTGPTVGTFVTIDRHVMGIRLAADQRLGGPASSVRVLAGLDLQRMRDDRTNHRAVAGSKDTLMLDQREMVTEVGPFVQLNWHPAPDLIVSGGGRYDAVTFDVDDHFLREATPTDNSGNRTMSALSGNAGLVYVRDPRISPYVNVSTSFETPTTTELANQPNSTGGFNDQLDPQRTLNYELGARGTAGVFTYSVSGFVSRIKDAIVQYREVSGRAYFVNAGKLKNDGLELGLSAELHRQLRVFGNYTYANYRFGTYRVVNQQAGTVDTLDGKRLPGVPQGFARLGLRAGPLRGVALDIDHTLATSIFADDQNTLYVAGLGSKRSGEIQGVGNGVTNLRLSWEGRAAGAWVRPFLGINNLWDREYVGSFTLNGAFGRVFETAPGRNYYLGGEIGWAAR
jgi:iron complex outermembrane receptor protein